MVVAISFVLAIIAIVLIFVFPKAFLWDRVVSLFGKSRDDAEKSVWALEKDPHDAKALQFLAQRYFDRDDYGVAYSYYSRLLVEVSNSTFTQVYINRYLVYLNFGICAYHLREYSEALTSLQKAKLVVNDMDTFDLFYYMGLIHYEDGNFIEASSVFHVAHEQEPEHKDTIRKLAISYYRLLRYSAARPLLEELEDPDDPNEITFYLAVCMLHGGDTQAAIPRLEGLRFVPEFQVGAWFDLARIYLDEDRGEKVLEMCGYIIDRASTGDVDIRYLCFAYYHTAKLLAKKGAIGEAYQILNELMRINPNYEDTGVLQKMYAKCRDSPQLFKLLEGNNQVREALVRKLVPRLVMNSAQTDVVDLGPQTVVMAVHCANSRDKYYIWLSLQNGEVTMRQIFQAHLSSKQSGCTHCIFASISDFAEDIEAYIEGRPIRLIENVELKNLLQQFTV